MEVILTGHLYAPFPLENPVTLSGEDSWVLSIYADLKAGIYPLTLLSSQTSCPCYRTTPYRVSNSTVRRLACSLRKWSVSSLVMSDSLLSHRMEPGSSVHGILQARILEWAAISFSRRSSHPRDQTWVSGIAGRFFTLSATRREDLSAALESSVKHLETKLQLGSGYQALS